MVKEVQKGNKKEEESVPPPPGEGQRRSKRVLNLPPSPQLPPPVETWAMKQLKWNRKEMIVVRKQEEKLQVAVEELQKQVGPAGVVLREKDETVKKLRRRLAKILEGGSGDRNREQLINWRDDPLVMKGMEGSRPAVVILPEELWKMILEQLAEPQDLWNCTNTCELFEDILHPWKSGWMLEQALPHLYKYLPRRKLLGCRSISKGWKRGVDSFLEGHPSLRPHEEHDNRRLDFVCPLKEKRICQRNEFRFAVGQDLALLEQPYLEDMRNRNRNPFIGRYFTLELLEPLGENELAGRSKEEWWAKLRKFLIAFGKEVWYLTLVHPCPWETEDIQDGVAIAAFLKEDLFKYFPNLRKLSIRRLDGCFGDEEEHPNSASMSFYSWDFPDAHQLETLECGHKQDGSIGVALINRYHIQLVKLHVTGRIWYEVRNHLFPNLKELHIVWRLCGTQILRRLQGLRVTKLVKLTVEIPFRSGDFSTLMEVVQELSITNPLTTLRLIGSLPYWGRGRFGQLRVPPTLTTLQLVVLNERRSPCYAFLLRCFPFLENLHVIYRKRTSVNQGDYTYEVALIPQSTLTKALAVPFVRAKEFIQVNKFLLGGEMYKSNIWELLPRLKVFSFQWTVYTRDEYESYVKRTSGGSSNAASST